MGRPKLTLPVEGQPLIARVVEALRAGGVDRVLVICNSETEPGAAEITSLASASGALIVTAPAPTSDMRETVEIGLAHLAEGEVPDLVLLAPGDSPGLSASSVARVLEAARVRPGRIVIPVALGRRGHPLALPWGLAIAVSDLPSGVGVNALLRQYEAEIVELESGDPGVLEDLDTPEDYRRWRS
jgi:molybdenum cofactor cytidylyltransferase